MPERFEGELELIVNRLLEPNLEQIFRLIETTGYDSCILSCLQAIGTVTKRLATAILGAALLNNNEHFTHIALDHGADPNLPIQGRTPLAIATQDPEKSQLVFLLFDAGARPECGDIRQVAQSGNIGLVELLVPRAPWPDLGGLVRIAARGGDLALFHSLLKLGATRKNWSICREGEDLPLRLALLAHHFDLAQLLIDLEPPNGDQITCLMLMIERGDILAVDFLIRHGVDVNAIMRYKTETALSLSIRKGKKDIIQLLLRYGAVTGVDGPCFVPQRQITGTNVASIQTALEDAVRGGSIATTQLLLSMGAKARESDTTSFPLGLAVKKSPHLIPVLLEAGADISNMFKSKSSTWETRNATMLEVAVESAIASGSLDIVEIVLRLGAPVNRALPDHHMPTALQLAVTQDIEHKPLGNLSEALTVNLVKLLLQWGTDVNIPDFLDHGFMKNDNGPHRNWELRQTVRMTIVQSAAAQGRTALVRLLVNAGANCNASAGKNGFTAIQAASRFGDAEMVEYLIQSGANVNAPPDSNYALPALVAAVAKGNLKSTSLLLQAGADAKAPGMVYVHGDWWEMTALQAAACQPKRYKSSSLYDDRALRLKMLKLLLNAHADAQTPRSTDSIPDKTSLGWAIFWDDIDAAKLLLDYGAHIDPEEMLISAAYDNGVSSEMLYLLGEACCEDARRSRDTGSCRCDNFQSQTRSTQDPPFPPTSHAGNNISMHQLLEIGQDGFPCCIHSAILQDFAKAASLLEDGDDFSNNLVSDLAPYALASDLVCPSCLANLNDRLLALFGERVTTQFMSQSTGWADCIALAMAPVGVITIIVSAIRVTGPRWLKAVVGRARENVAAAELEVMSSTSSEACELWNGKTRAVVRCPGTTENCEFICIYPTSMLKQGQNNLKSVQIMDVRNAKNRDTPDDLNHQEVLPGTPSPNQQKNSLMTPASDDTIIITRNTKHLAPNMTLNCSADGERWQMWACAVVGIIIQSGVLIFFGFLTEYKTLRFEKDDIPVENYAMPMAVVGTLVLNLGILVCAHAVDESSREEVYEVTHSSAAVAMVWLQKKTKVSEQDFDSAVIHPTMKRSRAYTSKRIIDNDGTQTDETQDNGWWLKFMSTTGTFISLIGFFVQFIGLRGMHWLATITQLGAVIIMTILRAVVRRHLASGLVSHDLCGSTGFELEWFVSSFLDEKGIPWIPQEHSEYTDEDDSKPNSSEFTFEMETNTTEVVQNANSDEEQKDPAIRSFLEVSTLRQPQGILDLRRHLGELSKWKGSVSREALAVANAIEKTMSFIMPYLKESESRKGFAWQIKVKSNEEHLRNSDDNDSDYVKMNVKYSQNNGWTASVDEIEAALSLWLYSMRDVHATGNIQSDFPSGNDHWIRGSPAQQQRCLQVLGPANKLLLRDLTWWMPKGLDGILEARVKDTDNNNIEEFPYTVKRERVGHSGQRWPKRERNEKPLTEDLSYWDWNLATYHARHETDVKQEEGDDQTQSESDHETQAEHNNLDNQQQPPQDSSRWLAVELQDPLERLYAKELFSAFIWAVATHLGESTISRQLQARIQPSSGTGPDTWKTFSLANDDLSRFVQNLTDLNLWTEQEVWCSIIPALSATDNLPGLNAVIEMAQKNAVEPEMDLAWGQAGSAYRWLFDIGMSSPQTSHIYVKSTAILWRFHQRLSGSESPHIDETYHERGGALEEELAEVQKALARQEKQDQALKGRLRHYFNIHQDVENLMEVPKVKSDALFWMQFDILLLGQRPERRVYGVFQRPRDIFDRTELHHVMRSKLLDHEKLPNQSLKSQHEVLDPWKSAPETYQDYIRCIKPVAAELYKLDRYPFRLLENLSSAMLLPFQTFEYLLDNGADFNSRDLDHWTPLHYACQFVKLDGYGEDKDYCKHRDKMRVATLIANKAQVNAKGLDGNTPLHCAAMSGRHHLVELLVDSGGDVKAANFEGRTPLHLAAMVNDMRTISMLIQKGSEIDAKDQGGRTPLHLATISRQSICMKRLVDGGARLDVLDNSKATPLRLAVAGDFLAGYISATVSAHRSHSAALALSMQMAIAKDDLHMISIVMDITHPDSWPLLDKDGMTPFHYAAFSRKIKSLDRIFEKSSERQFDPEAILSKTKTGDTAFHVAQKDSVVTILKHLKSSPSLLKRLMETKNQKGYSALFEAVYNGQYEVALMLIDEGADIRTRSNDNRNILHMPLNTAPLLLSDF
ncbi:hypothetical protein FPOA_03385 [Fusarium poae]|uniref:Protein SSH4 n=1 Tax=Fusarium poae TaxID=36050 RepID=A0A1B8B9Q2_FUSPO|nr:hypothetical protein FPOA_03385 [Fusarium poae]